MPINNPKTIRNTINENPNIPPLINPFLEAFFPIKKPEQSIIKELIKTKTILLICKPNKLKILINNGIIKKAIKGTANTFKKLINLFINFT